MKSKFILYIKKAAILIFITAISAGCNKDFLETKPETDISDGDIFSTIQTTEGVLHGVYRLWRNWTGNSALGIQSMDCTGLHSLALVTDVMGPDVALPYGGWYNNESAYSAFTQNTYRVTYPWWLFYTSLNNINNVLINLDDVPGNRLEKDHIRGEALAMRAFSYFYLVRTYQHTYAIASDLPGVPIYTEPARSDTKGNPRAAVKDVYTLIVSDLLEADSLLDASRDNKYYFNKNVVDGLLARVYLTMEKWEDAVTYAEKARNGYPLMTAAEWKSGFNDFSNGEWIWGELNTPSENPDWGSAFSLLDFRNGNQRNFRVSGSLVDAYATSDIRGQLLGVDGSNNHTNLKFVDKPTNNTGHYPLMRSAEMYLIEAEAKARSLDEPGARTALLEVQHRADPNAVLSTNAGQALIDEILLEKRKEFWGEGVIFWDMLRNGLPLTRDADHPQPLQIPARSWQFIYQLPDREILVNQSLDQADQNPSTGVLN